MQMNSINLTDRVAVITGGAQGIGFEVGKRFLASGVKLAIWDINEAQMVTAQKELGHADRVFAAKVNIADPASVDAWFICGPGPELFLNARRLRGFWEITCGLRFSRKQFWSSGILTRDYRIDQHRFTALKTPAWRG